MKKKLINKTRTTTLAVTTIVTLSSLVAISQSKRPNIIYIMSDDHAVQAISAYGHPLGDVAPTPNIDRIANSGIRHDAAYCGNSISGPSRAAVLTGKHSHANGFMENNGTPFDAEQLTLPKILQNNGYKTAMIGKWHLGSKPTGFDYWTMLNDQGQYYNPQFITEQDTTIHKGYVTDLITDYSIDWIDQQRENKEPFFIMVHHKAPHRNWKPAPRHLTLHDTTVFPEPETLFDDYATRGKATKIQMMTIKDDMFAGYDLKLSDSIGSSTWINDGIAPSFNNMTPEERKVYIESYQNSNDKFNENKLTNKELISWKYQRYMRDYFATIASVDENVGRLLDYLEETKQLDNTIIIYTSDQGFYLGEHGWYDKRFMYEESMRMPFMMMYTKEIKPNSVTNKLTQNIDFAPTILDYCGIDTPKEMHGKSFRTINQGNDKNWRKSLYYRYYEKKKFVHNVMKHVGVKQDRYKLICFMDSEEPNSYHYWELFDLKKDPNELNNIYGRKGTDKITKKLLKELKVLAKEYNDTLPDFID